MMASLQRTNRKMFWRIIGRLLVANPGRLFVILLALGSGAAVTAALLNLQIDAKRRLTTEFRSLGANVTITPRRSSQDSVAMTMTESLLDRIPPQSNGQTVSRVAFLYAPVTLTARGNPSNHNDNARSGLAIVAGYRASGGDFAAILPHRVVDAAGIFISSVQPCALGEKVASQFHLRPGERIELKVKSAVVASVVSEVWNFGGTEDNQVFVDLASAQGLANTPGQVSLIQLSVPGTPEQIEAYISSLQNQLADVDVRSIRQFTEGEAKIYNRISGLLTATVLIILLLTFFCVMAAMTNVAMERRNDVGLMKALGGSVSRIVRLFFAEAAVLGLASGFLGSTIGILISIWLGKAVFGLAARPRLIVYPVAMILTVLVSLASALPLRRLASIRPASVFRGEA
ncbi:MAG TPA: FtsX-like permease family protein [Candidatus Eremiobacteraceae bacterium]|nr:FtsX-like permease family protein [Candidatus Eremiobacteraceae bacterium]